MFSPLKARICEVRVSRVAWVGVEGGWRPSLSWPVVFVFVFVFCGFLGGVGRVWIDWQCADVVCV